MEQCLIEVLSFWLSPNSLTNLLDEVRSTLLLNPTLLVANDHLIIHFFEDTINLLEQYYYNIEINYLNFATK